MIDVIFDPIPADVGFEDKYKAGPQLRIFMGDAAESFLVLQSTFEHVGDVRKTINNEHIDSENISAFHFEEDNLNSWEVLLLWLIRQGIPQNGLRGEAYFSISKDTELCYLLINEWVCGGRCMRTDVQNTAMLELLGMAVSYSNWSCIRYAFGSAPSGSPVRKLFAGGAIYNVYILHRGEDEQQAEYLRGLEEFPDANLDIEQARHRIEKHPDGGYAWRKIGKSEGCNDGSLLEFMVWEVKREESQKDPEESKEEPEEYEE